jgi:4-amino-4-deoxychorismate lyase
MYEYYPSVKIPSLVKSLNEIDFPKVGLFKCRVIYDSQIRKIEFHPYSLPSIRSLKIIETNITSLAFKLLDRTDYQNAFSKKGECDDVLMVKNGLLTDTSYCNIALFDGQKWYTPQIPLLYGVNRAQLIENKKIIERNIAIDELKNYQRIALFNAMIAFGEIELEINSFS